ncbi:hypothetical protein [Pedobacter helvus]|uniref:Uncharacterized protein n=1 Tax=Pedobacter helvus TaxID=2563444 RepID=A0ABW9JDB5_9SPHI|nr:hypothetical protein [Pedobacter ureilyticus]
MTNKELQNKKTGNKVLKNSISGIVLTKGLNSHQFIKDMEEIANLKLVLDEMVTTRDFKKKYNRKYTYKESKKRPLPIIYEEMGVGFLNKTDK